MTNSEIDLKRKLKEEISDDDEKTLSVPLPAKRSKDCPYLDSINRKVLDFGKLLQSDLKLRILQLYFFNVAGIQYFNIYFLDFEKFCSISFSRINVYACMVCGKYFQGRGQNTHAYTHSVGEEHRVFLNLETKRFYCLPDNYEIIDPSLNDIIYVLNPTFTNDLIKKFETSGKGKLYFLIRREKIF